MAASTSFVHLVNAGISIEKPRFMAQSKSIPDQNQIRAVLPSEYKAAAACLAEAFAEDLAVRYPIDTPDRSWMSEEQKYRLHTEALEYITYAHILKGLVTTVGPNYDCVALWMPPGQHMDDWLTILRSGLWRLNWKLSVEGRARMFTEFFPLLHDAKAETLGDRDDDAWYLVYIGTKPDSRGNGYCRKLIENITKKCDTEGRPCYLESSNESNPIIYRKLGFETVKQVSLQRAEQPIHLDIMIREPKHEPKF